MVFSIYVCISFASEDQYLTTLIFRGMIQAIEQMCDIYNLELSRLKFSSLLPFITITCMQALRQFL